MPETAQFAQLFQLIGAVFAALLGLAFGSFLNVVLVRLPAGENIAVPGSHCRSCAHMLSWWENLPVLSWLFLRGRCRQCGAAIGLRYPAIELAIAILWTSVWMTFSSPLFSVNRSGPMLTHRLAHVWVFLIAHALLSWMLVALAALDAEHFWLPDIFTIPGIVLGLLFGLFSVWDLSASTRHIAWFSDLWARSLEAILCAGIVLIIRLAYWLVRRREGMGLGDAKLMAMLGAWLGLIGALESFAAAILLAFAAALVWLAVSIARGQAKDWARMPLPFGTFLCLAALSEIFYPAWLSTWWVRTFMP